MSTKSCPENHPLLLPSSRDNKASCCRWCRPLLEHICVQSKPAALLLGLVVVVGAMHTVYTCVFVFVALVWGSQHVLESLTVIISYLVMITTVILYPVSGFFADVICGRYRVLVCSTSLFIASFIVSVVAATLVLGRKPLAILQLSFSDNIMFFLLLALFGLTFGTGYMCYYPNFIQFGLDQLVDASSGQLSLFVHWILWADSLASAVLVPLASSFSCHAYFPVVLPACSVPFICLISLIVLLMFVCLKRHWFYTEPRQHNPYKTIFSILNFARKHTHPLQRSAFTFCDDERPHRLDFCKERYGGPFTTEQVEDVKTFTRILLVLIAITPVFVFDVSSSLYGLPLIGVHIAHKGREYCSVSWILLESGALKYITSAVTFPVYICFIFHFMRKKLPGIFTRLKIGICLYLIGVSSILIADVVGHAYGELQSNSSTQCMFAIKFDKQNGSLQMPLLGVHWASLIPANVFFGIGQLLVFTTSLEFISAQCPHSMKGLTVGIFVTLQIFFQMLGSFALLPFSLETIWGSEYMREHPPAISCGSGYLLLTCVVALLGLILFSVVAKRYKYRERDDKPYDQQYVENVYDKYLKQVDNCDSSYDLDDD